MLVKDLTRALLLATREQRLDDIKDIVDIGYSDVLGLREALNLTVNHLYDVVTINYENHREPYVLKCRNAQFKDNAESRQKNIEIFRYFMSVPILCGQLSQEPKTMPEKTSAKYVTRVSPIEEVIRRNRADLLNILIHDAPSLVAATDALLIALVGKHDEIFKILLNSPVIMRGYDVVGKSLAYASTQASAEKSTSIITDILSKIPEKDQRKILLFALFILEQSEQFKDGKDVGIALLRKLTEDPSIQSRKLCRI